MPSAIISYIMSGGIGSRLWPISRKSKPKQFHPIIENKTFLLHSLEMLHARKNRNDDVCIIASQEHEEHLCKELENINYPKPLVFFEPLIKNTAATICLSALYTVSNFVDSLVLVVSVDHHIENYHEFWNTIEKGRSAAEAGYIVLFGVEAFEPEIEYGYIFAGKQHDQGFFVESFVEKPKKEDAEQYIKTKKSYWNTGIFLFRSSMMHHMFHHLQPTIFSAVQEALAHKKKHCLGFHLPMEFYAPIPSISFDHAIIQSCKKKFLIPVSFGWKDCGNWNSLRKNACDAKGNVAIGDVVSMDCENTYLRSENQLLCVAGMKNTLVVSTPDAVFICPVEETYRVKDVFSYLEKNKRRETTFFASQTMHQKNFWRVRIKNWLFNESLPIWAERGFDYRYGGFYEALDFDFQPILKPKRIRTLSRQIYTFSLAKIIGWDGPSDKLIENSLAFMMERAWSPHGGLVHSLDCFGKVEDSRETSYDHACFLLALGYAYVSGHTDSLCFAQKTLHFIDEKLDTGRKKGFLDFFGQTEGIRSQNPHMHFLEAFLLWYEITQDVAYLDRAFALIELFLDSVFDFSHWTVKEFFTTDPKKKETIPQNWVEPGHHFEWVHLLLDFCTKSKDHKHLICYAHKLYTFATGRGINPLTGLVYAAVTEYGEPLNTMARSWSQAERLKALIALHQNGDLCLMINIQQCLENLFSRHIDPAPSGLWVDAINKNGNTIGEEVPASIFYHLISAMKTYLDYTAIED